MADATFNQTGRRVAEFPPSSARKIVTGELTTDGSNGASAGDIPATLFGLTVIESCSPLVKSDNTLVVVAAPAYAGTSLLGKAAATAAAADIPSGTYRFTLRGY
jgi:hypothetical protein